jgi:hypothetical protein
MSATFKTTIERERQVPNKWGGVDDVCEELEIEVTYDYARACGDGWNEPREAAHIENIWAAYVDTGIDVELTEREQDRLEDEAMDDVRDRYEAAMEAKADARRDDR